MWGPALWPLLHSIAHYSPASPATMSNFLLSVAKVLPCIYCRNSFTEYIAALPFEPYLSSGRMAEWMYLIHNKVNDKLRRQGIPEAQQRDPPLEAVIQKYDAYVQTVNEKTRVMPGWKALYAIAAAYPIESTNIQFDRHISYFIFFSLLPQVIPFCTISSAMLIYYSRFSLAYALDTGRAALESWLYGLERFVLEQTQNTELCCTFQQRCAETESFRAGCGSKRDTVPTCRAYKA